MYWIYVALINLLRKGVLHICIIYISISMHYIFLCHLLICCALYNMLCYIYTSMLYYLCYQFTNIVCQLYKLKVCCESRSFGLSDRSRGLTLPVTQLLLLYVILVTLTIGVICDLVLLICYYISQDALYMKCYMD